MKPNTNEDAKCVLCDIWWIILIVFLVVVALALTSQYWLPLLGLA